jgi:hypothetical protein
MIGSLPCPSPKVPVELGEVRVNDMAATVIDNVVRHVRIIRFHGESYRSTHSLMNNQPHNHADGGNH